MKKQVYSKFRINNYICIAKAGFIQLSCPKIAIHKQSVYGTQGTRILFSSRE